MGHYASEMEGPLDREKARAFVNKTISNYIANAIFKWTELYPKYEKEGVYHRPDDMLTCPVCFSEVRAMLRTYHDRWHESEKGKHLFGGPGLFG